MPTDYERRLAITLQADAQQDIVIGSVLRSGFALDWNAILRGTANASDPVDSLERAILDEFNSPDFRETVQALSVNGKMISAYAQRKHELLAGLRAEPVRPFSFAEPAAMFTPRKALEQWKETLDLTSEQIERLLEFLARDVDIDDAEIAARITSELVAKIIAIYDETIRAGLAFDVFAEKLSAVLPDASKALLETEYRTTLSRVYSATRQKQIQARKNVFPFMQFMAVKDGRTTWWICLPMGTAGDGRGYIAATDDPIWLIWHTPCHWRCRSALSPISYREAIRMRILSADGVTKLALVGGNPERPFGEPPMWAEHPTNGTMRRVQPQDGFGA